MKDQDMLDKAFNEAAKAYLDKFGGSLPIGIGYPELTTDLLLKAVKEDKQIIELPLKNGAMY